MPNSEAPKKQPKRGKNTFHQQLEVSLTCATTDFSVSNLRQHLDLVYKVCLHETLEYDQTLKKYLGFLDKD